MSDDKTPSGADVVAYIGRWLFRREALLAAASIAVLFIAGGSTVIWAQANQKGVTVEVVAPIERRIQSLEDGGRRHAAESAEVHLELKKDMAELARDVRELYRVVRDPSRRSERLEQPVVSDGGAQ